MDMASKQQRKITKKYNRKNAVIIVETVYSDDKKMKDLLLEQLKSRLIKARPV